MHFMNNFSSEPVKTGIVGQLGAYGTNFQRATADDSEDRHLLLAISIVVIVFFLASTLPQNALQTGAMQTSATQNDSASDNKMQAAAADQHVTLANTSENYKAAPDLETLFQDFSSRLSALKAGSRVEISIANGDVIDSGFDLSNGIGISIQSDLLFSEGDSTLSRLGTRTVEALFSGLTSSHPIEIRMTQRANTEVEYTHGTLISTLKKQRQHTLKSAIRSVVSNQPLQISILHAENTEVTNGEGEGESESKSKSKRKDREATPENTPR